MELTGDWGLAGEGEAGGVRGGLSWRDVDLEGGYIRLTAEVAKTTQARLVKMSGNLRAWLVRWGGAREGRVVKNPTAWKRARRRIEEAAGVKWGHDYARHSFATHFFALTGDRNALEAAMGHTVGSKVLETAYRGLATREEAERYWGILPDGMVDEGTEAGKRGRAGGVGGTETALQDGDGE